MQLLGLDRVTRRFGDFIAVGELSFCVAAGEVVGFLGANGAGKTTTLRMILDILHPSSGSIEVLGGPPGRDRAAQIGFLPEERGLYRGMSVSQAIVYFGRLKGLSRRAAQRATALLVERFGLGEFRDRRVERLSKGMAQKVQLATALVNEPKLLLLDEPFSGLDPISQAVLQDEIAAAAKAGVAVVFSTHVMEYAERLCTRYLMLAHGRKVFDGDPERAAEVLPGRVHLRSKSDPALLPGVASAEQRPSPELGWTDWLVVLQPGVESGDVLQACTRTAYELRAFEARNATLHEVFLHLAGSPPEQRR